MDFPEQPEQRRFIPKCPNCGEHHPKSFCPQCGQNQRDLNISFWFLMKDFINTFFSMDSRLFKSLAPLFVQPGSLTLAFISGKRMTYVSPVRVYLFCSVIFFLTVSTLTTKDVKPSKPSVSQDMERLLGHEDVDADFRTLLLNEWTQRKGEDLKAGMVEACKGYLEGTGKEVNVEEIQQWLDQDTDSEVADQTTFDQSGPLIKIRKRYQKEKERIEKSRESDLKAIEEGKPIKKEGDFDIAAYMDHDETPSENWFYKKVKERQEHISQMQPDIRNRLFIETFFNSSSKVLFLLMPVFALFLKIVYIRRKSFYIDHFIFALHFHAFLFGGYSILIWLNHFIEASWLGDLTGLLVAFGSPIWLWFSMKTVYGQGWLKTSIKFFILNACYIPSLIACMAIAGILTLLTV